jgi:hypothetical protein
MYHTIKFDRTLTLVLETSPREPLAEMSIKKGTRLRAQVRPFVLETKNGPVEAADLFFEDGTATRGIYFSFFSFVE